jgi:GT2 family glycosyltransferase
MSLKSEAKLNLAIGIATAGRREVLSATLDIIARQTRQSDRIVICPADSEDVDPASLKSFPNSEIVSGARGLCSQRNAILQALPDAEIVVFFDDDFLPAPDYLAEVERLFQHMPDVVAATGKVLADGIGGPGYSRAEGLKFLQSAFPPPLGAEIVDTHNAYGCNMVLRLDPVRQHQLRFDENLPAYGWLEDVDFCRRLAPYGRIVHSPYLQGVHLGTKRGRTSGVRFGYSQIANPIYMARKGSLAWRRALRQIGRNLAANIAHAPKPEAWIDRRGRIKGNYLAFRDLIVGKLAPQRILDFK